MEFNQDTIQRGRIVLLKAVKYRGHLPIGDCIELLLASMPKRLIKSYSQARRLYFEICDDSPVWNL